MGQIDTDTSKWRFAALAALVAAVVLLPQFVENAFAIDIFIRILLFSFIGVAWNLMGGYAKQLSLGHVAYFGLGAYTSTLMQINFNISPWIGMVAGGIVAMLASLPIGWLCFRLRGPYFTIATLATAQALMLIFLKFRDFAWGAEGTTIPNLGNSPLMMQFESKAAYYTSCSVFSCWRYSSPGALSGLGWGITSSPSARMRMQQKRSASMRHA